MLMQDCRQKVMLATRVWIYTHQKRWFFNLENKNEFILVSHLRYLKVMLA